MAKTELLLYSNGNVYECAVLDGITLERTRKRSPTSLKFKVLKQGLNFQEGDTVSFKYDGKEVFWGYAFTKKRNDLDIIDVIAYDQLRYFKNKDTYLYENKTADQLLKMIAADFQLNLGNVANTKHRIASAVEDNKELFEIVQNSLDMTTANTGEIYVLYDDFRKLSLVNIQEMKLDLLIDRESGQSFSYTTSIDSETYNKIKLSYENKDTGKREIYISQDSNNISRWGVLQKYETINEQTNGKSKADSLLKQYNQKSRTLNIDDVFGDVRVRGGSVLAVALELGDMTVANYMIVDHVKHVFNESSHTMSLRMIGGEFIA